MILAIGRGQLPCEPKVMSPAEQELWKLCQQCWKHSPRDRILIGDAIETLAQYEKTQVVQLEGFRPHFERICYEGGREVGKICLKCVLSDADFIL